MKDDIFLAYDIRGRNITTHDSFLVGKALGSVLTGTCVVGYDSRKTSPELTEHLIEGLRTSGIKVINIGLVPVPVCYYKVFKNYDFGVYVTGSHLPADYNGFKISLRNGVTIDEGRLLKVKESFYKFKFKSGMAGVSVDITALNDYASFLEATFGKLPVKCVVDCFNASTSVLSNRVFSNLLNARVINDGLLPDFGGRNPEPCEENLGGLRREVLKTKSSFGVGLDGDGDRSVFIDEKGVVINGNLMTLLFAKNVLKRRGGGLIVVPVSISSRIESFVKQYGGRVLWCRVGHRFIEEELFNNKGVLGGEFSSHFYFNEYYPFSDGIISTLMLARMIHESGKKLSELVNELPRIIVVKEEIEFPTHKAKNAAMKRVKHELLKAHPNALTIDGVKFSLNDGSSVLVRASETRHTVKVYAESGSKDKAKLLLKEYASLIK